MNWVNEFIDALSMYPEIHELRDTNEFVSMASSFFPIDYDVKLLIKHCICVLNDSSKPKGASLRHENGFTKISLYRDPKTSLQVRLHIWPESHHDTSYHNHRWNFLSFVITGELQVNNYMVGRQSSENGHRWLKLSDADDSYYKKESYLGQYELNKMSSAKLLGGCWHFANSQQIHEVIARKLSMTIMVTGAPLRSYSDVFRETDQRQSRKGLNELDIMTLLGNWQDV